MIAEVFKNIPGYEGYFQASNLGEVKSLERVINMPKGGTRFIKEKILSKKINKDGYYCLNLSKDGNTKNFKVHQIIAMAFLNHIPCGLESVVNHINFIRTDNRLENLEIVTMRENSSKRKNSGISKFTGVSMVTNTKKWIAKITINDRYIHLGTFDSEKEASDYYNNALKDFESGNEISIKKALYSSKYKGVSWHKAHNKWHASIKINNKKKHLGSFECEIEARNAYQKALNNGS